MNEVKGKTHEEIFAEKLDEFGSMEDGMFKNAARQEIIDKYEYLLFLYREVSNGHSKIARLCKEKDYKSVERTANYYSCIEGA